MLKDDDKKSNEDNSEEETPKTDIKPPIYDTITEGVESSDVDKKDKEKDK